MEIYKFEEIKELLKTLISKKSLVPILGAGFTKCEKTNDGIYVPDGDEFKQKMIVELLKHPEFKLLEETLTKQTLSQVSEYFFNESFVLEEDRKTLLKKYFLDVSISPLKKEFLSKTIWPYIYTFNIDDAIETNSSFRAVMPYKNLDISSRDTGCVYKIHGDVFHEITYKEPTSLIFSEAQYVASIMKNKSMLNFLKSDLFDNNLIFIGCSLSNEIDLMYALATKTDNYNPGSKRILVTRKLPANVIERLNYEKYGINIILQVTDYNQFYHDFISTMKESITEISSLYKISGIKDLPISKNENLEYLLQNKKIYTQETNTLLKPIFTTQRTLTDKILESVNTNPITIVKGRRFSGKSYLALNIAEKNKSKDFYYFPSSMKIDENILLKLLKYKNSLIFFDSNVLDQDLASLIKNNIQILLANANAIIIICNNMEIDIANTFLSSYQHENEFYFELANTFNEDEFISINTKLSSIGIIEFKRKSTILDNIFLLRKIYPNKFPKIDLKNITMKDAQMLIILSLFDKVYTPVCIALGINRQGWLDFIEKFTPLVELVETTAAEREQHSRYKIVVNSKIWLVQLLKEYHWSINQPSILENIKIIIKTFKQHGQYQLIQQRVMLLDSLNEIMGKEGGSYKLMRYIYENLQDLLSDYPDYWLQRAKVIYKLEKYSIDKVKDAIDYAKKAYFDGHRIKTIHNAEFTIALLYAKLCIMEEFKTFANIEETIEWFSKAINTHEQNRVFVNSMLENKNIKVSTFQKFILFLETGDKPKEILQFKDKISLIMKYKIP